MISNINLPTVKELYSYLSGQIPTSLSSEWDNDGLMVCPDSGAIVNNVLLTLDVTSGALKRAAELGCCVVISHHPLLFHPLKSITDAGAVSQRAIYALQNNITVVSFHTRLDAVIGGVNDVLAS
ncbi:MAG TPA: Nif3-like dinuclear metal center hexameric protein, partial [Bacillota bacterium]|nr:Nif3-like dinuclear metal center hexameric protein [Bacillota bacterium]